MRVLSLSPIASLLLLASLAFAGESVRVVSDPRAISPPEEQLAHPVWSPSGEWIAATKPNYQGIWLLRPDGSELRQISAALGAGYRMEWSPDGARLICRVSRRQGKKRVHAIQVISVPDGQARLLTDWQPNLYGLPHWLGNLRAFVHNGKELEAWSIDVRGKVQTLSAFVEGTFYVRGPELFVPGRREPIYAAEQADAYVLNVTPSPDGQRLAFEVSGGNMFVVSRDGKSLIDLGPGHRPRWSPDGEWIVCFRSTDDGHRYLSSDLYAVRADGQTVVRLTDTPDALEMDPSWSPDGRRIVYYDHNLNRLYVFEVQIR